MRLSRVVMAYYVMGAVMFGGGVIMWNDPGVGLVDVWVDEPDNGVVEADDHTEDGGMLSGLIGPIQAALDTVAGGTVLSVWHSINRLMGFAAWPIVVSREVGAPAQVTIMAASMTVAFTFGTLKVFRASV